MYQAARAAVSLNRARASHNKAVAEAVVHPVDRLVMTGAKTAQVRVCPPENRNVRRATAVMEVEEAELIPTVRIMVALSPSRILSPRIQAEEDTENNEDTKKRSSNVFRCQTHYAIARG